MRVPKQHGRLPRRLRRIFRRAFTPVTIRDFTVLAETPITTLLASYAVSESSILASLTSETGAACTGMFEGSILDAGSYEINGVDVAPSRSASNIFGVIAPEGKFEAAAPVLIQSLTSFAFTDEYIQEAIRQGICRRKTRPRSRGRITR